MRELPTAIPDVDVLLALEPEELGAKLLFLIRERLQREVNELAHLGNIQNELFQSRRDDGPRYPDAHRDRVYLALSEAWSWLEAQGLLVPAPGSNGANGFRLLSRRAQKFQDETEFTRFATARRLPKEALHSTISTKVWAAFMRGEYDVAVFQAMKAVEVAVREAAALPDGLLGVKLMRAAFAVEAGPLTDMTVDAGERVARMELFAGAVGSYKNPHSHRDVHLDDPSEAIEIILFANHLLRIVDARAAARSAA